MMDEGTEGKDLENIQWISRQVFISLISSIYTEKKEFCDSGAEVRWSGKSQTLKASFKFIN